VTVSMEWLFTKVARVAPLNTTTDEDTKLLPFAVSVKLGGNCENVRVGGEIELRTGTGRALPHSGFSALQARRNNSASTSPLRRAVNGNGGIKHSLSAVTSRRQQGADIVMQSTLIDSPSRLWGLRMGYGFVLVTIRVPLTAYVFRHPVGRGLWSVEIAFRSAYAR